jgi:hypothetical protein
MSKISDSNAAEAKTAQHVAQQNEVSHPDAGAKGSNSSADESLNHGRKHDVVSDLVAHEVVGAAAKATRKQTFGDGNGGFTSNGSPKSREGNTWGTKSDKSEGKE